MVEIAGVKRSELQDYLTESILNNLFLLVMFNRMSREDITPAVFPPSATVIFLKQGRIVRKSSVDDIRTNEGKSVDALFREVFKC